MYKIMYKFGGRWYPLTSHAHIIYFHDKFKCEEYARFLEKYSDTNWSEWFCAFDINPDKNYTDIKGYRI